MPVVRFSVLTFLGALPWNLALVIAGYQARDNWENIKDKLHYVDYTVLALIIIGLIYLAVRWLRAGEDRAIQRPTRHERALRGRRSRYLSGRRGRRSARLRARQGRDRS